MQAHAGLIDAASIDGRLEVQPGYPVDKAVGAFAVQAIVAALFAREKGGGGERIDLAMLDVIAYYDFPDLLNERVFVDEHPADAHSRAATANRIFPASDGSFVLAPVSGSHIKGACAAVGHPEWAAELFAEPHLLMENMHRLLPSVTVKEPLAVWLERFTAHDVPVASCLGIDEHLDDPQVLGTTSTRSRTGRVSGVCAPCATRRSPRAGDVCRRPLRPWSQASPTRPTARRTSDADRAVAHARGVVFTDGMTAAEAAALAVRVEELGYSALWLPETTGRDPFAHIAFLATHTSTLVFATGIASIFHRHAGPMKQAAMTLAEQTEDRFVLGLGVSHQVMVEGVRKLDYARPLAQMRDYLGSWTSRPTRRSHRPAHHRGSSPRSVRRCSSSPRPAADGAHPYFSTPEHTAIAREILGPDKLLCVEQKVVVTTDAAAARAAATAAVSGYAGLPNYRNNWLRLGFTDDDIEGRAERFIDAVVAWGDESAVRARIDAHYDAGADHVCVQPLPTEGRGLDLRALEALAPG